MGGKAGGSPPSSFTGAGGPTGAGTSRGTTFESPPQSSFGQYMPQYGGYVPEGSTPLYPVGGRQASQQPAAPDVPYHDPLAPPGERQMHGLQERPVALGPTIEEQVQAAMPAWLRNLPPGWSPPGKNAAPPATPTASDGFSQGEPTKDAVGGITPNPNVSAQINALRQNWR